MRGRGHEVRLLQPPAILGARVAETSPLFKWSGLCGQISSFPARAAAGRPTRRHRASVRPLECHVRACTWRIKRMSSPAMMYLRFAVRCGHFPENPVGVTGRTFQQLIARGLRQAQAILCVSRKTRDDLEQYLGVPEERLHVVPNALPWPYKPVSRDACAPLLRSVGVEPGEQYFFHIGGNHWYKNRGAAIEIFAELRKLPQYAGAKLVMAGGPMTAALREIAREASGSTRHCWRRWGSATSTCRRSIAARSRLLFPSLEEGFGWPILEAQACGCPVVTTDRPPMNEVAGGAAILIDPAKPETAAQAVADALQDTTRDARRRSEKCGMLFRRTDAGEMRGVVSRGCGRGPNAQALSGFSSRRSCKFIAVYSEPMHIKTEGSWK